MTFEDWRDAPASDVERLYHRERDRWRDVLRWDTSGQWHVVEQGRLAGYVCGWLLRGARGQIRGWTYFVNHAGTLHIGGLVADRAGDLRRLIDRVLMSPEAALARRVSGFVFPGPPSLASALARRRFAVRRSLYLDGPTATGPVPPNGTLTVRTWTDGDLIAGVRLLGRAYDGVAGSACFAPEGRLDEWVRYVRQLVEGGSCGVFLPEASFVAEDAVSGRPAGLVLSTRIADDTAHIAQIAVERVARGLGLGERLVAAARTAALQAGCERLTLMVDEDNAPARALYARVGFVATSRFLFAERGRLAPRTGSAVEGGGPVAAAGGTGAGGL